MCVEVRKRGVAVTDNRYLNSYLTSMNCVRGKEHNVHLDGLDDVRPLLQANASTTGGYEPAHGNLYGPTLTNWTIPSIPSIPSDVVLEEASERECQLQRKSTENP